MFLYYNTFPFSFCVVYLFLKKKKKRVASVILIGLGNKILQSDTYIHLVNTK